MHALFVNSNELTNKNWMVIVVKYCCLKFGHIGGSSNGRTEDFESSNEGPIPSPPATRKSSRRRRVRFSVILNEVKGNKKFNA